MDAVETVEAVRESKASASELVAESIERIDRLNPIVNAVVTRLDDEARQRAHQLDNLAQRGRFVGPLHGVPVLVKDLFEPLADVRNTMGCSALSEYRPTTTAIAIQRLIDAGAVIVGKTNVPEFGHKGVTDNLLFGPTRCPFDLSKNSGGSSGGSAAAVACGMTPIAQGSDAGGSIRIPAAWCGVVGLKLSYGRIPNTGGLDAFASHTPFVHCGPIGATVRDAALMATVMSGPDPSDPFSIPASGGNLLACAVKPLRRLRIGYASTFGGFPVDREVASTIDQCVNDLRSTGLEVMEANLQFSLSADEMSQLWRRQVGLAYAGMFAAMSSNGEDFLVRNHKVIPDPIHEMVDIARNTSAIDAQRDGVLRSSVFRELQSTFEEFDLLLTPTVGTLPVANSTNGLTLGPSQVAGQPTDPLIGWCLTHPVNFTGHPAASVPGGLAKPGLPVGLQIIGRRFRDDDVVAMAAEVERRRPWYNELSRARLQLEQRADDLSHINSSCV